MRFAPNPHLSKSHYTHKNSRDICMRIYSRACHVEKICIRRIDEGKLKELLMNLFTVFGVV